MDIALFTKYADEISSESSDTGKTKLLSEALERAGDDIAIAALFFQGEIFPEGDSRKVDIGPKMMQKALSKSSDVSVGEIEDIVAEVGDIGSVCEEIEIGGDNQKRLFSPNTELSLAYQTFTDISDMSGSGSTERKLNAMSNLLVSLEDDVVEFRGEPYEIGADKQAKYMVRIVLDEMRIGVGQGTVRDSIAEAFDVDVDNVERGIMVTANIGRVARVARDEGDDGLSEMTMTVGNPVEAMLATTGEIDESVADWESAVAEVKYDGARLQLHRDGDDVWLFTRGLEDVTDSLPEIERIVKNEVDSEEVILDGEILAYDPEDKSEPLPFQEVMKRLGRKHDVEETKEDIVVNVRVFDVLYNEGAVLMENKLRNRYETVKEIAPSLAASHIETSDTKQISEFEAKALSEGHEGIMLKNPVSPYSPGKRGQDWRKVKPDPETLDCVVVGGEMGEGNRAGWIGTYMLAVRDEDTGELEKIGKVATGMTEKRLEELTERFESLIVNEDGGDLSIHPEVVFEVGYEEIQPSPDYSSGYGLRFPRFLGVREDKRVEDIDTVQRVEKLAEEQS